MKKSVKITEVLQILCMVMLIGIVTTLTSCSGNSNQPGHNYSANGVKLCKKAIRLYEDINNSQIKQGYYEEFVKILNAPSPETYIMKSINEENSGAMEYLYINNALRCLENAFTAYNLQLDTRISAGSVNLSEKFLMACTALDSLKLNEVLRSKNINIKKNIGAGKYRVEGSLFQITDIYAEVWNELGKKQLANQIAFQKDYENGIKSIPVESFNADKIKAIIDEPYNNSSALVNLYKLKLIKDNQERLSKLASRINNIAESFNLLLQIQGELMKRKQDKLKIQEMSNSLEVLLTRE